MGKGPGNGSLKKAFNLAWIHRDSEGRIGRCGGLGIRPCPPTSWSAAPAPVRPAPGISAVIPQLLGADGDALRIIEGAGGDALEIALNGIKTILNTILNL